MIKPASPLPFVVKSFGCSDAIEKQKIMSGSLVVAQTGDESKLMICNQEALKNAEYIKVACNEFPALVHSLQEFKSFLEEEELEMTAEYLRCRDLLKRCGVDV